MTRRNLLFLIASILAISPSGLNATDLVLATTASSESDSRRSLFDLKSSDAATQWRIVNDSVMGGRSSSRVERIEEGIRFSGNLSLANNGGFASMRSRPKELSLRASDTILLRVRGDGRTYTFNLYVPQRQMAFSYRMEFRTVAGQWAVVRLPAKNFVATSFGRVVQGMAMSPGQVNSVGITLSDKRPGSFAIEVESIHVESAR